MPVSPSTDNFTIGKGRVIFDGRDLGNVTGFSQNITIEKLEHLSSRSGMKNVDKEIPTQTTVLLKFTVDEMSVENVADGMFGDIQKITQPVGDITGQITAKANRNYILTNTADATRKFNVGVHKLTHGVVTDGPFVVGDAISNGEGTPSTADVIAVGSNYVYVKNVSGSFSSGDTITEAGSSPVASATLTTDQSFEDDLIVKVGSTIMTKDEDYDFDGLSGRIRIIPGGAINDDDVVIWEGSCLAKTYSKLTGLSRTNVVGPLEFVPDVPEGTNIEMNYPNVSLTPTGDFNFISDELITIEFEAKVLKKGSTYMEGYVDDIV